MGFDLPQPDWNTPSTLAEALARMALVTNEVEAERAHHDVLYAVGNNHAGTYYPVVLEAIPFLAAIVREGECWPTHAALETLIDLFGSFWPEPGFEAFHASAGQPPIDLRSEVGKRVLALRGAIETIAAGNDVAAASARTLLADFDP